MHKIRNSPILLGVNVDHVAMVRQQRGTKYPDPVFAAFLCELAGADQITVHLREDRRHIQERDLWILKEIGKTHINLEMAITDEMLEIALKLKPHSVTLVPEKREERTTEGGLNVKELFAGGKLKPFIEKLNEGEIIVSLFINPEIEDVHVSFDAGAQRIEIHTGRYADATVEEERKKELEIIKEVAKYADSLGLYVAAGHGLDYNNVRQIAEIEEIKELNIGHSIVSRAIFTGIENAVREMLRIIGR